MEGHRVTIDPKIICQTSFSQDVDRGTDQILTEHENKCVHRNHILSVKSLSCEWILRTSATREPALR